MPVIRTGTARKNTDEILEILNTDTPPLDLIRQELENAQSDAADYLQRNENARQWWHDLWAGQVILNHWHAGLLHFVDDNPRRHHQHDRLRFPGAGGRRAEGVENLDHQRLPLLFRPFQRIPSAQQHGAAVRDTERFMQGDSGQLRLLNELRERDRRSLEPAFELRRNHRRNRVEFGFAQFFRETARQVQVHELVVGGDLRADFDLRADVEGLVFRDHHKLALHGSDLHAGDEHLGDGEAACLASQHHKTVPRLSRFWRDDGDRQNGRLHGAAADARGT